MNSLLNPGTPPPQIPPEKSEWHPIGITLAAAVLRGRDPVLAQSPVGEAG
jgi:hypothetical protein